MIRHIPPAAPAQSGRRASPLSRTELRRAAPWVRGLLGIAIIAYSALATIDGVRVDCGPLCAAPISGIPYPIPLWVALGIAVAAALSLGQWMAATAGAWGVYTVLLLIDARYSQWWLDDWTMPLAAYHTGGAALAVGVGFVVSWIGAILVAVLGELLLFGRRT